MGLGKQIKQAMEYPDEVVPLMQMYLDAHMATYLPQEKALRFCYGSLQQVSRSFAMVIQQLPKELRDSICIFYLVLRALDTVEDDTSIPNKEKVPILRQFYEHIENDNYVYVCGEEYYRTLMENFPLVIKVYKSLDPKYKAVIKASTEEMGNGMADFIENEVNTIKDLDMYCYYVAGLIGRGLSQLYAQSGYEQEKFLGEELGQKMANDMGLFLQKTNILRDYLEDIMEQPRPRMFWPREIWSKYAEKLEDLQYPQNRVNAVRCLNEMIKVTLPHIYGCIDYLDNVQNKKIFRFCAIPQVMAVGTLAECFDNEKVFEGVVKLRRGETAKIWTTCNNMKAVCYWFTFYLRKIQFKAQGLGNNDPNFEEIMEQLIKLEAFCQEKFKKDLIENPYQPEAVSKNYLGKFILMSFAGGFLFYSFQGEFKFYDSDATSAQQNAQLIQRLFGIIICASILYFTFSRSKPEKDDKVKES